MRKRTILLLIFFVLVGVFVVLNWAELSRSTMLNLGVIQVEGPLGLVMLGVLALAMIMMLAYAVMLQTAALLESREHTKELKAQRELADKAEASRFTELRTIIDRIEIDSKTRGSELQQWFEQRMGTLQHDLGSRIDNSGNTLAAYMGELEDKFEHRESAIKTPVAPARDTSSPATTPLRETPPLV